MLTSILPSNQAQIERAVEMVLRTGKKNIGVLGLSFKPNTDDLRESPIVTLVERLIGKGLKLSIYDREVELARLFGANREFIDNEIPHISSLMKKEIQDVIDASDVMVIAKKSEEYRVVAEAGDRTMIDLVSLFDREDLSEKYSAGNYHGICW
jgi:GDP-mannose 6-dehydrogenase